MSSYREVLKMADRRAKEKRLARELRARGDDGRELWFNCGLRVRAESGAWLIPQVVNRRPTAYGQDWLLHLPVGLCKEDIRRKANKLAAALGGEVEFQMVNDLLLMRVMTQPIQNAYPFELVDRGQMYVPVPIGYGRAGLVVLDLSTAPHLLVGGTPGFGKSAFLRQAIVTMLAHGTRVCVIDLKRVDFAYLKSHVQVVTTEEGAAKLLRDMCREMERRLDILERLEVARIQDLPGPGLPFVGV